MFIETFWFSWEIVLGSFLKIFFAVQWVIVTVIKNYSKSKLNSQNDLNKATKMKKNVTMASFCYLVHRIWKKIVCFYYKREKHLVYVVF